LITQLDGILSIFRKEVKMRKRVLTIALGILFTAIGSNSLLAQDNQGTTAKEKYKDRYTKDLYEQADTNRDGYVSLDEARAASSDFEKNKLGEKRFNAADLNHDGRLSIQEARKYRLFEMSNKNAAALKYKERKGLGNTGQTNGETVTEQGNAAGQGHVNETSKVRQNKKQRIENKRRANKEVLSNKKINTRKRQRNSRNTQSNR
jgi:uncharacterized membrane protein YgaE (UPF0421/DUF939 family)